RAGNRGRGKGRPHGAQTLLGASRRGAGRAAYSRPYGPRDARRTGTRLCARVGAAGIARLDLSTMTLSAVAARYANALADVVTATTSALSPQQAVAELRAFESALRESSALYNALI